MTPSIARALGPAEKSAGRFLTLGPRVKFVLMDVYGRGWVSLWLMERITRSLRRYRWFREG